MERIGHFLSSDLLLALVEKDFRESFLHLTQSCMWDRLVNDSFGSFAHKVGRPIQEESAARGFRWGITRWVSAGDPIWTSAASDMAAINA
jgi:hypothetical protein